MKLLAGAISKEEAGTPDSGAQAVKTLAGDDLETLGEEEAQDRTCTKGLNEIGISPQQPENDHSKSDTEEEKIQAQLLRDMPVNSKPPHQGNKLPETPRLYPGLSTEDAARLERQRKIAEAVAQSHLRLKLLIAAQQANPGSYLITHDGLPRLHPNYRARAFPPRGHDTPIEPRQMGTPDIIWSTPRTPGHRAAQLPSTPQGRSITLVSPTHIKIEPPSIVRAVKMTTPRTARSVTVSPDGRNSDVFYTPMSSKRPRLE